MRVSVETHSWTSSVELKWKWSDHSCAPQILQSSTLDVELCRICGAQLWSNHFHLLHCKSVNLSINLVGHHYLIEILTIKLVHDSQLYVPAGWGSTVSTRPATVCASASSASRPTGNLRLISSVGAMWTFERTIDFDRFSRQTSRFRFWFRFFWLPKCGPYTGLTEKVLTVAFSPVHTCDYSLFRSL